MSAPHKLWVGLAAGSLVAGGVLGVTTAANAGTKPPPCTKKAIKVALKALTPTLPDGAKITEFSKVCQGYWAGGGYMFVTPDGGSGSSSYLLQASNGKWKLVPTAKKVRLCNKGTIPAKVEDMACRMQ